MTMNEMKALSKLHTRAGLWMVNAPVPEIGPDDVLIKINKTGICGTDIHIWNWDDWAQKTVPVPMITGHEFAGEIVEIGRDVQGLEPGQRCSGEGHLIGTQSRQSRAGKFHLDPATRGIGVNEQGAFAQYLRLPAFNVVPLPDEISDDIGAILDPLGNAVHTALSFDLIGEDVLVTGAGPIGIMAAAVARHAGARHVVITDVNPDRLALAAQVADVVPVNVTQEALPDVIARLKMKQGFDVGMEMSGNQQALDQMVEAMTMGGRIAMLGIPPGQSPVDWSRIVFKAITIKGVYGREIFETWYKMIAMLEIGLDVSRVITHRFHVDDFEAGFAEMKSGQSGKVVLDWT
ncbi:L-threonine 3-dehydrogenase [Pseudosulfitobacter pseudonitzschiae]|uniref:L-threonine 3-dehydrogenase n=1 Tax=Pseudosulfitobacter pseudonitzschiae TaxID=1402135 RepID=UPI001AF5D893|nr:L-threonine 3-dehydrogenase [Pseudosulfitobacter pseudonitzschiae]MBM1815677.1 L-threonine 3-dehydrogenase [Pseudosulfitobacter pseudonitzschiae]MBM1832668.1 L-threonine 3-dehydrogenase [Pseudosulfitobacter pseudonitzschiae]MBM1837536.1 L-threonine 3-dehydrogenase [Pseudosulfitobacter pseudonitzschiae]MBM1842382.1 L-threonine 3-dehydrogenase [Pseudosulfitobacter pseudonitzschiae]MBM1847250.1 L-threonine 3-dehydrogenase [Pseudosulfitobacter pseudonitzschiae]